MQKSSVSNRWRLRATWVALFSLCLGVGPALAGIGAAAWAAEAVYRCGNDYTNDAQRAKKDKCLLLDSGAVVTVPMHKRTMDVQKQAASGIHAKPSFLAGVQAGQASGKTATPPAPSELQQKRDSDAKLIIESELKKTEVQLADLRRQFDLTPANVSGSDLDKKTGLKQQIARHEADIVSLKRELKR
jgi:hypothetical protein